MAITYGDYVTPIIPNTTMQEVLRDAVLAQYRIQAVDGYVLHDSRVDGVDFDEYGNKTTIPLFKFGDTTVAASYDFDNVTNGIYTYTNENGMEVFITVKMIGMYKFYTLAADIVPTGNGDNNHEITMEEYEKIMKEQEEENEEGN